MKRRQPDFSRQSERLQSYLDSLTRTVGHADRVVPLENYTKGLLLPVERKSVEPMAARLAPGNVRQLHESLHHFVADAAWSDAGLLKEVGIQVLPPAMTRRHRLLAWIVDDTGFPKKGSHSWLGVTRQYCGQVGKQENSARIAVSISLWPPGAGPVSSCAATSCILPEVWANDPERRRKAGVPEDVRFQTKPEMALAQFRSLLDEDVPRGGMRCWPMRPMEMITASVRSWRRWDCNMSWASSLPLLSGRRAPLRFRRLRARNATGRPASLLRKEINTISRCR